MTQEKKRVPMWAKLALVASTGAAIPFASDKLTKDSPVHFGVVGQAPKDAVGWDCKPEGGIYGAPLVCRYRQLEGAEAEFSTGTETK